MFSLACIALTWMVYIVGNGGGVGLEFVFFIVDGLDVNKGY